jgi:hypothetical protein
VRHGIRQWESFWGRTSGLIVQNFAVVINGENISSEFDRGVTRQDGSAEAGLPIG